jgi:hypothetical protein
MKSSSTRKRSWIRICVRRSSSSMLITEATEVVFSSPFTLNCRAAG